MARVQKFEVSGAVAPTVDANGRAKAANGKAKGTIDLFGPPPTAEEIARVARAEVAQAAPAADVAEVVAPVAAVVAPAASATPVAPPVVAEPVAPAAPVAPGGAAARARARARASGTVGAARALARVGAVQPARPAIGPDTWAKSDAAASLTMLDALDAKYSGGTAQEAPASDETAAAAAAVDAYTLRSADVEALSGRWGAEEVQRIERGAKRPWE